MPQGAQYSGSISQSFRRQQTKDKHSCEHAQDAKEAGNVNGTQEKLKLAFTHPIIWMSWNRSWHRKHAVRRLLLLPSAGFCSSPGHAHVLWLVWQIAHWVEPSSSSWIAYPIPFSFAMGHGPSGKARCTRGWEEVGALCSGACLWASTFMEVAGKPRSMKVLSGRRTGWHRMQGCYWHVL